MVTMRCLFLLVAFWSGFAQTHEDAWLVHMREGNQLRRQGRYREALRAFQDALDYASTRVAPDPSQVASARSGTGAMWLVLGDLKRGELLLRESIDGLERARPGEPASAMMMLNLALVLEHQDRYREAEETNSRATAILEKTLGSGHPHVGASLNNRGQLLLRMSRCAEALDLFERAQRIWESALGAGHEFTATTMTNIGNARFCLGEYSEAQRLLGLALRLRERTLAPEHPDVAQSLANYAAALEKLGRRKEASVYKKRALKIRAQHASENLTDMTVDASTFR